MLHVVTYDLNDGWDAVKEAAFQLGFYNIIETTIGAKQAPNTTLFIDAPNTSSTLATFDKAVADANSKRQGAALTLLGHQPIFVEKVFATRVDDFLIRSNKP
jgi:hypothetical protein